MRVESNLQDLSYISEACVCAVPDRDATELCAAVVRLRDGNLAAQQSVLHRIRADLSEVLPAYMLPTIIRVMKDEEVVPKTQSGKIVRRFVAKRFFNNVDWQSLGIQPLGFQYFGNMAPESEVKNGA
jgi:malonyl-CoA/methylmalonyl-CoA synthetase